MTTLLSGKAVAITGAGGSIGRALAIDAARRGALVLVNDVRAEAAGAVVAEIRQAGGSAVVNGDAVHTWSGARSVVDACISEFGRIDALVNNAALVHRSEPWEETEAEIRAMIEVNVLGVLFCGHHAMQPMIRQGGGAIINFSSASAFGLPVRGTYSASKAAVAAATFSWAFDLKPHGIRVNAVAPSALSRMRANWWEAGRALGYGGIRPPTDAALAPTRRTGSQAPPENIAPLVTYLLSDRSAHVTGQFFQLHESRLTLVARPRDQYTAGVTVERTEWTLDAVAEAVEQTFQPHFQPVVDYLGASPAPDWPTGRERGEKLNVQPGR